MPRAPEPDPPGIPGLPPGLVGRASLAEAFREAVAPAIDAAWRSVEPTPGHRKRGLRLTHLFR